jgi:hypothetical protein
VLSYRNRRVSAPSCGGAAMSLFPIISPGAAVAVTVTSTASGTMQTTNASSFTFSGLDIYDTQDTRKVVIQGGGSGGGTVAALSGVTVGGASCSLSIAAVESETACEQWYIDLDNSTTTGDVVLTWASGNKGNSTVEVYVVENAASGGPTQTLTSVAAPGTNALDIPANGAAIAGWMLNTGTASARTTSWNGLTESASSDQNNTTEQVAISAASGTFSDAQTNLTITATLSGSSTHEAMVMAAYGPA